MPRTYVRKTNRGSWSNDQLQRAVEAASDGCPLKTCARDYKIPVNTLRRHVKKAVLTPGVLKLGRCSLLGAAVENELVDYIVKLEERGFGLTPKEVRELAYCYAADVGIDVGAKAKANEMLGEDWWSGFRSRHKNISIRKPEALSVTRAACMNKPAVAKYFSILKKEMIRLGVTDKPHCIYNCDESGLSLVPETVNIVGTRGKRSVHQITSAERGVLTTVVPCYNAAGDYVPPMIVYKGKRMLDDLRKNVPHGSLVCMSDTGYMNKDLFLRWLQHFNSHRKSSTDPALLILDGHGSHVKAIDALKFADKHNITIICLPPHTTHRTQPLDVSFFKPLKSQYANSCRRFMRQNPGKVITRNKFPQLFSEAYVKTVTMDIAVNSFRCTGIFPFNDKIFPDSVFLPSATTDIPAVPVDSGDQTAPTCQSTVPAESEGQPVEPGQSAQPAVPVESVNVIVGSVDSVTQNNAGIQAAEPSMNRFVRLSPIPQLDCVGPSARKKGKKSTTSRVLTSKQHLAELQQEITDRAKQEADKKRKANQKVSKKGGKKKVNTESAPKVNRPNKKSKAEEKISAGQGKTKKRKGTSRDDGCFRLLPLPKAPKLSPKLKGNKGKKTADSRLANQESHTVHDNQSSEELDATPCSGCGEPFYSSKDDWLSCTVCDSWFEMPCAGMLGKTKEEQDAFVCRDCRR